MSGAAFRDDVDRMSIDELRRYVGDLELRVDALQGSLKTTDIANLMRAFDFTKKEAILVASMRDGLVHPKEGLLNAIYWAGADDPPEIKIIDVFVCKARKKLVGSGADIGTSWGVGYYLTGGDVIRRAMSGEAVQFDNPAPAEHGRLPGDRPFRKSGEVRDLALAFLRGLPRDATGVVSVGSAALYAAIGNIRSSSSVIWNLVNGGHIKVLNGRTRRNGEPYRVRLL